MASRLELHDKLVTAAGNGVKVYFQPPASLVMSYPCVVYERDYSKSEHADNEIYRAMTRYAVMCIDSDPDSKIHERVSKIRYSLFSRHYTANNLNHDVYNIYI